MSDPVVRAVADTFAPAAPRQPGAWDRPEPYVMSESLRHAVDMAHYLGRPLLLEGDPGAGKTRLAYAAAYERGYPLKTIYIRSTSRAQDLLYTFDAVRRLYDIQERSSEVPRPPEADDFSIALTDDGSVVLTDEQTGEGLSAASREKRRYVRLGKLGEAIALSQLDIPSVVLIDEIDKADIDFPNDLLLVLDRLQFEVDEVPGWTFDALKGRERDARRNALPLVIATSNREKELPAAFLRRCLFYYIEFPGRDELAAIVRRHFSDKHAELIDVALAKFMELRGAFRWRKAPSTSELIDWVAMLLQDEQAGALTAAALEQEPLRALPHLEALAKTQSDRDNVRKLGGDGAAGADIEKQPVGAGISGPGRG